MDEFQNKKLYNKNSAFIKDVSMQDNNSKDYNYITHLVTTIHKSDGEYHNNIIKIKSHYYNILFNVLNTVAIDNVSF